MIKISRFIVFLLIILACTKSKISEPTPIKINQQSPNIVFIIADDMGWDVFGQYPRIDGTKANTPTLDSLAKNGISFTNFWVNPECAPTRVALLTGKYGFRTELGGVQAPQTATLKNSELIIQKYINDKTSNAYATDVIGKWHVSGNTPLNAPETFGVNYYSGFLSGAVSDYYNWTETSNGVQKNITDYATTRLVDNSVSWIEKQTKPFFLTLTPKFSKSSQMNI